MHIFQYAVFVLFSTVKRVCYVKIVVVKRSRPRAFFSISCTYAVFFYGPNAGARSDAVVYDPVGRRKRVNKIVCQKC